MLDINVEFTKGVLFIRLEGILDDSNICNIQDTITKILKEGGIRYLVFNVHNLKINCEENLFEKCEQIIKLNDGKMLICGMENNTNFNNYKCVNDELTALRVLSVC